MYTNPLTTKVSFRMGGAKSRAKATQDQPEGGDDGEDGGVGRWKACPAAPAPCPFPLRGGGLSILGVAAGIDVVRGAAAPWARCGSRSSHSG